MVELGAIGKRYAYTQLIHWYPLPTHNPNVTESVTCYFRDALLSYALFRSVLFIENRGVQEYPLVPT